jgi:hypothetical protein
MSHVRARMDRIQRRDGGQIRDEDLGRQRRRSRNNPPQIDSSSLATVRELLKEVRRLEDEVRALLYDI